MANHPANTESPAVAELVRALRGVIPELRGNGIGTIRNDGSRHTAGLAVDIMLDSTDEYEKMIADDIIAALIDMQGQIRWHDILYTDWLPELLPEVLRGLFISTFQVAVEAMVGSFSQKIRITRWHSVEPTRTTFTWTGLIFRCASNHMRPFSSTIGHMMH